IQELLSQYQNQPIGTLTTTYTVTTTSGEESVVISVEVIQSQTAEAGTIADRTVSETSPVIVLDESVLSSDAMTGGTFSADPDVLNADGNFDPSLVGPGVYPITYTIVGTGCVTEQDSVTFNITVTEEVQEPNQIYIPLCSADINNPNLNGFRSYFNAQVSNETDLPLGGTYNPT
ncbi:hypothetical protein, partial [Longispora fulva]|uniref:hypothetical protein n=1 Tax=Longispora fulva TaxID=619741 RepID=UPI0036399FD6